jgi:hypothetical protein
MFDYRSMAKDCLTRAKAEIASGEPTRLKYAALEVRHCMEAITYSRAQAYRAELPPEALTAWRPRDVLSHLEALDPTANLTATISVGVEHEYGVPPPPNEMKILGTDRALSIKILKQNYDAIGSYLHIPTMAQIGAGKLQDNSKLEKRLLECIGVCEQVLASPIFNVTLGIVATLDKCVRIDCGKSIRRRIPPSNKKVAAECPHCGASYSVQSNDDGTTTWQPNRPRTDCVTPGCSGWTYLWDSDIQPGKWWRCEACGKGNRIVLGLETFDTPTEKR